MKLDTLSRPSHQRGLPRSLFLAVKASVHCVDKWKINSETLLPRSHIGVRMIISHTERMVTQSVSKVRNSPLSQKRLKFVPP